MWVIRLVLTVLVVVVLLLLGVLAHFITWLISLFKPEIVPGIRSRYARAAMSIVWFFGGGKETVIGLENIPRDRAVVFVGNHRSLLDVVLAGKLIPFPVGFIAKIELQKIPLLNLQMRDINCLFLDRKDDRQALKVVLKAIQMVKDGQSMFVFPEGTRSKEEGKILPFHAGTFKIATKAKAPIVPVTIVGMGDVLEDHFPRLKRAPVVIEFGSPIETASMDRNEQKELPDRVRNIIVETYSKNAKRI